MKLSQILDRPIAYHRAFVTLTGSVKAAIMLSQAVYWQARAKQKDGWWYKTAEEWEDETGLTRYEQSSIREKCSKYLKSDLRGVPATLYWQVDEDAILSDLGKIEIQYSGNLKTSFEENEKPVLEKTENINMNTETTTETTTEIKDISAITKKMESIGMYPNSNTPDLISAWVTRHEQAWIFKAIDLARGKNQNYVDRILIGWEANGYPKTREQRISEAREPARESRQPSRSLPSGV